MLAAIGVAGEPLDPSTSATSLLDEQVDPLFLTGSVQPVTFRAITTLLINALPAAERHVLGAALIASADSDLRIDNDDENQTIQKRLAMAQIARVSSPALDSTSDQPLFLIHMRSSQRTIVRDVEAQVRIWKQRLNLPERRIHTDRLPEYLEVWDRREGWDGGGYRLRQERSFRQIASELGLTISTVATRYRAAFEMITGYEFGPRLWSQLFGPLKYSELLGDTEAILSTTMRHRLATPTRREVPESVVSPATAGPRTGIVNNMSAAADDASFRDYLIDIAELSGGGRTDDQIAQVLGLDAASVASIRAHLEDFRDL
jgi:DNA-binding CsgD family transcriptional regulator